jgi:hypothetical protein
MTEDRSDFQVKIEELTHSLAEAIKDQKNEADSYENDIKRYKEEVVNLKSQIKKTENELAKKDEKNDILETIKNQNVADVIKEVFDKPSRESTKKSICASIIITALSVAISVSFSTYMQNETDEKIQSSINQVGEQFENIQTKDQVNKELSQQIQELIDLNGQEKQSNEKNQQESILLQEMNTTLQESIRIDEANIRNYKTQIFNLNQEINNIRREKEEIEKNF